MKRRCRTRKFCSSPAAGADVWKVDMKRLTGGIVHTKLLVVDEKHLYVGSANMDWRALTQVPTGGGMNWCVGGIGGASLGDRLKGLLHPFFAPQVKELGAVLHNCSCLARDLLRIFATYRILGQEGASIPAVWPSNLAAESSLDHPLKLQLDGANAEVYISVGCPLSRTPGP